MFKRLFAIIFGLSLIVACATVPEPLPVRSFELPKLPSMITNQAEAIDFMATHYWDRFSDTTQLYLTDSTHVAGIDKNQFEQKFADFASLLLNQPLGRSKKAVAAMYEKFAAFEPKDSMAFMSSVQIAGKYLYDPNSQLRCEDLYLVLAEKMAGNMDLEEVLRNVYVYDASMCALNPVGSVATDFAFCDKRGKLRTLHSIKADMTFLFFSNPGCHSCKEIITSIVSDAKMTELVAAGKLAIVNVYIDEDIAAWREYLPNYPESWYNGYDHNHIIRAENLYNIRAIPSVYLLDKDKKVIMKDVPEMRAISFIDDNL